MNPSLTSQPLKPFKPMPCNPGTISLAKLKPQFKRPFVTMALLSLGITSYGLSTQAFAADIQFNNSQPQHVNASTDTPAWLGPQRLSALHHSLLHQLKIQPLEDSFQLQAQVYDELTTGNVYAVMPYAYEFMSDTLTEPQQVCQAIFLHINVKGCVTENTYSDNPLISLYVGKKEYQHPENAIKVQYKFSVAQRSDKYTLIAMTADKGPLSTENINIYIELLPIDAKSSFVHFLYSANYGNLARFALNTYLATMGRNKVGFSAIGVNNRGDPVYIKGIQGVVERNTMRYFFALHSYFSTYHQPESKRFDASLNRWFDYVEKYPQQLLEVPREEYLKSKHKELRDIDGLKPDSRQHS